MYLRIVGLAIWLLWISACQPAKKEEKNTSHLKAELAGDDRNHPLGGAYDSKMRFFMPAACLSESEAHGIVPNRNGWLTGGFSESRETVVDKFGAQITVAGGLMGLEASGGSSVEVAFAESDLKTTSYLSYVYRAGNIFLKNPQLSSLAEGLMNDRNPEKLRRTCGDQFVYRVDLGARFNVGLEYVFASRELKNEMKVEFKVTAPLTDSVVHSQSETFSGDLINKKVGSIHIVLEQDGGDQVAFKRLVEDRPKSCVLKTDDAGKLQKSGFQECTKYWQEKILPYMRNALPNQINRLEYASAGQTGLAVLNYYTHRYDAAGFPELQSEMNYPNFVKLYMKTKVRDFDERLFRLNGFARSLDLGIIAHPDLHQNTGNVYDPEKLYQLRQWIKKLVNDGRLHIQSCSKDLLRFTSEGGSYNEFNKTMRSCSANYERFDSDFRQLKAELPRPYEGYL